MPAEGAAPLGNGNIEVNRSGHGISVPAKEKPPRNALPGRLRMVNFCLITQGQRASRTGAVPPRVFHEPSGA